jgi:hypothetical protein
MSTILHSPGRSCAFAYSLAQRCVILLMPSKETNVAKPSPRSTRLSGAGNLRRLLFLGTLQLVGPEQLQLPIIEPHIQSQVLWLPEAMLYRTEHPSQLRSPVGL